MNSQSMKLEFFEDLQSLPSVGRYKLQYHLIC
jgi:hypothetical protein